MFRSIIKAVVAICAVSTVCKQIGYSSMEHFAKDEATKDDDLDDLIKAKESE